MKYHIVGAHKETAADIEILVEGETEEEATKAAADMGLLVEKVEPASAPLATESVRFEYHTLRCDFRDLQTHLNKYAGEFWRVSNIHHDPHDDKMVRVLLERIHRVDPSGGS